LHEVVASQGLQIRKEKRAASSWNNQRRDQNASSAIITGWQPRIQLKKTAAKGWQPFADSAPFQLAWQETKLVSQAIVGGCFKAVTIDRA
jgi:hypothetical protein